MSDHGDLLGSHGYFKKQQPYDESIRIPMIFYVPERLGGKPRKLNALINVEDVMPTLLGLCSIDVPKTVEGFDYSNYIKGGENPGDTITLISCVQPFGQWSFWVICDLNSAGSFDNCIIIPYDLKFGKSASFLPKQTMKLHITFLSYIFFHQLAFLGYFRTIRRLRIDQPNSVGAV